MLSMAQWHFVDNAVLTHYNAICWIWILKTRSIFQKGLCFIIHCQRTEDKNLWFLQQFRHSILVSIVNKGYLGFKLQTNCCLTSRGIYSVWDHDLEAIHRNTSCLCPGCSNVRVHHQRSLAPGVGTQFWDGAVEAGHAIWLVKHKTVILYESVVPASQQHCWE